MLNTDCSGVRRLAMSHIYATNALCRLVSFPLPRWHQWLHAVISKSGSRVTVSISGNSVMTNLSMVLVYRVYLDAGCRWRVVGVL